ncbi:MAG: hypothetical protein VX951_11055 [Planctomycetota bacterium]|nr:hypothetical protein [Planctomycetota bacterium]
MACSHEGGDGGSGVRWEGGRLGIAGLHGALRVGVARGLIVTSHEAPGRHEAREQDWRNQARGGLA